MSVHLLHTFCPARSSIMKCGTTRSEKICTGFKNNVQNSVFILRIKTFSKRRMYHNWALLSSLCKGKEEAQKVMYHNWALLSSLCKGKEEAQKVMYHNCALLSSLCKGKEEAQKVYTFLLPWTTGVKTNMLLIFFVSLIATLNLVCYGCNLGTKVLGNFNWTELCVRVLTGFVYWEDSWNIQLLKLLLGSYFILDSINELSIEHIRLSTFV